MANSILTPCKIKHHKKLLPAFLWTGKFASRKNSGIESISGLLCADVDKIPDRVGELHDIARQDRHVTTAFVSPSGNGIKIVFRVPIATDAKQHARNFAAVRAHVASLYHAQVDEAAKDVAHDADRLQALIFGERAAAIQKRHRGRVETDAVYPF